MMIKVSLLVPLISLFIVGYWCISFKQDGARVKSFNPKYIKDCAVFTGRRSRRGPYLTNMTGTFLMPFANNVTLALTLQLKTGGDFRVTMKLCDTVKTKWIRDFIDHYSNVTVEKCPFPAVRYRFTNMELPPKNMPVPLINGDYYLRMELYITATKEPVVEAYIMLHFEQ